MTEIVVLVLAFAATVGFLAGISMRHTLKVAAAEVFRLKLELAQFKNDQRLGA